MGTSANKAAPTSPDPRPTGDLEYLFRQKLGEAEVAPRFQLWEQLDHDLLVQQNEAYRKRLLMHRWVAAACVLLLLSVGGWLGVQQLQPSISPELAGTTPADRTATDYSATAAGRRAAAAQAGSLAEAGTVPAAQEDELNMAAGLEKTAGSNQLLAALSQPEGGLMEEGAYTKGQQVGAGAGASAGFANTFSRNGSPVFAAYTPATTEANYSIKAGASTWDLLTARAARLGSALGRFTHPDTLKPSLLATPPMLAAVMPPMGEEEKKNKALGGWRFGGSHAVSAFNPNINFAQASAQSTSSAINNLAMLDSRGVQNVAYETGAAEYRQNLRAGVGQRMALTAARSVGKHWVLLAGVEAAEYRASSETSFSSVAQSETAFAGRATAAYAVPDNSFANNYVAARPAVAYTATPRATSYRYRTVGVPVAARYGSQKTGVSLYAKVGAAVDLLLGSRVEVADEAAATRDYSLSTADSPYRQVIATVRGGGGVQYRPAGATWAILAGPTAEAGLTTLNRDPAQALLRRSRPYMVGVEASVEFGGGKAVTVH
ncbi:hypothetical protein [Hymenobacter profundi]|uniref:Outer membrane protein beta-barrel domain-containing protein n=1 Tax=Hymenobacter profundi TaxID=1982110 RepID=A0ABS6X4H5_9BACT|nr:hypothetical protein [Hymenobacter profundi]MBW3130734.1 hypothetical protein [Hymenobacter profundi]